MASSTSSLLLLFILAVRSDHQNRGLTQCNRVGAYLVEGSSNERNGVKSNTNIAAKDDSDSPRVRMPSTLLDHASPLDTKAASSYAAKIEDGSISQHSRDFCSEAKLLCDANLQILDPSLDISLKNLLEGGNLLEKAKDMIDASQAKFFGEKDLVVGKEINVHTTFHDEYPTTSFLPVSLAKLLPFSSNEMPTLLQILNIPQNSNLAAMMARTLAQCEAKAQPTVIKESSICVTSLEDMTKFVADRFPQDSRIYALDRTIPTSSDARLNGKSGITTLKVLDVKEYQHSVVCHKSVFPYAVYECYNMDNNKNAQDSSRIYALTMESQGDGNHMKQVASCRADSIESDQTGRKGLIPGPLADKARACHWISDAIVWAPAAAA